MPCFQARGGSDLQGRALLSAQTQFMAVEPIFYPCKALATSQRANSGADASILQTVKVIPA